MKPLTIVAGPTAVGKSAVALAAARAADAAIISADSMQVYRGLAIGTAQPSASELAEIRHHLVGHVEPGEDYNVARFVKEANRAIDEEAKAGRRAIVCGGTGLFLNNIFAANSDADIMLSSATIDVLHNNYDALGGSRRRPWTATWSGSIRSSWISSAAT